MQLWSLFSDVDLSRGESEGWNCQSNEGKKETFYINAPLSCRCSAFCQKIRWEPSHGFEEMTRNIPLVFMFLDQILHGLKKEILAWLQP